VLPVGRGLADRQHARKIPPERGALPWLCTLSVRSMQLSHLCVRRPHKRQEFCCAAERLGSKSAVAQLANGLSFPPSIDVCCIILPSWDAGMRKSRAKPIDVLVGKNIRTQRLAKGISQTKLADAIGITFQQVQKYEKGTNRVGASRLMQISEFLKVPIPQLFEGAKRSDITLQDVEESPSALLSEPYVLRAAQALAAIRDSELRRSLVDALETIAAKVTRSR